MKSQIAVEMSNWLVVGISGVSGGGKTTLANALYESLTKSTQILECYILHQDDYFLPQDYEGHLWMPELKHVNWDVIGALDMDKMLIDVINIMQNAPKYNWTRAIKAYKNRLCKKSFNIIRDQDHSVDNGPMKVKVLIIEGFLIMNHDVIREICDLKFYLDLTKEQCYDRRKDRVYDPPDVEGYFDKAVWAGHLRNKGEILKYDIEFLDGMRTDLLEYVKDLVEFLLHHE